MRLLACVALLSSGCFDPDFFTDVSEAGVSAGGDAADMFAGDLPFIPGTDAQVVPAPAAPTCEACRVTRLTGNGQLVRIAADGAGGSYLIATPPGTLGGDALAQIANLARVEPDGAVTFVPVAASVGGLAPAPGGVFIYGNQLLPGAFFFGVDVVARESAFVARVDAGLTLQWLLLWQSGLAPSAASAAEGGVLVGANIGGVAVVRVGDETPVYQGVGDKLAMVASFASDGSLRWGHPIGTTTARVGAVAASANGAGAFVVDGGTIELWDATQLSGPHLVGVTSGGDVAWAAPVTAGDVVDHLAMGPDGGTWMLAHTATAQLVAAHYDGSGALQWRHVVHTPGAASWSGVAVGRRPRAFVVGAHAQPFILGRWQGQAGVFVAALERADGAMSWQQVVAPSQRVAAIDANGSWVHAAINSFDAVSWPPRTEAPSGMDGVAAAIGLDLE